MKPKEPSAEELQARTRRLVAEYGARGVETVRGISAADRRLLLGAKQSHLAEVSQRCSKGLDLNVNVVLKRLLERDVREIGKAMEAREPDMDR